MRPLLLLVSLALAPAARAADCPVPMVNPAGASVPLDEASPFGRDASGLVGDFEKLRHAAGFGPGTLLFGVNDSSEVNAFYVQPGRVLVNTGFLAAPNLKRNARLMALAHEIGHAVQDRDGDMGWKNAPFQAFYARGGREADFASSPEGAEYYRRNRQFEAHADSIGQELLDRAGYGAGVFAGGSIDLAGGCQTAASLRESPTTHPLYADRQIGQAVRQAMQASARARGASDNLSAALAAPTRSAGLVPSAGPVPASAPRPYVPAAKIGDYDGNGRIQPGRLAAESLRIPPPPPGAGPVREHATWIAGSFVNRWVAEPFRAAVNRLTRQERFAATVLESCGNPQALAAQEDYGVFGWSKRIAAEEARSAAKRAEAALAFLIPGKR
jgi:hypothetical protein